MTISNDIKVMGAGSPILDMLLNVEDSFLACAGGAKGGMELVDSARIDSILAKSSSVPSRAPGGSAANTIGGLARLGIKTAFLGKIGLDEDGNFYKNFYQSIGGDTSAFRYTDKIHTGRCLSLITPDSERTMRTDLGAAAALSPDEVSSADYKGISHYHAEGYMLFAGDLLVRTLKAAREAGVKTISFDMASFEVVKFNMDKLPGILKDYIDIVFANEVEAETFCGTKDPEAAVKKLAEYCSVAVVKLGKEGSIICRDGKTVRVPAELVKAVDTTGAGDLWQSGFLYAFLNGASSEKCGQCGSVLGAEVVSVIGAAIPEDRWPSIRSRVKSIINQN